MDQSNPLNTALATVGVAGGAALLAPVAAPTLHGVAGIAVVGLGIFAAGSAVQNASGFLGEKASSLLGGVMGSKPARRPEAKSIPFNR